MGKGNYSGWRSRDRSVYRVMFVRESRWKVRAAFTKRFTTRQKTGRHVKAMVRKRVVTRNRRVVNRKEEDGARLLASFPSFDLFFRSRHGLCRSRAPAFSYRLTPRFSDLTSRPFKHASIFQPRVISTFRSP